MGQNQWYHFGVHHPFCSIFSCRLDSTKRSRLHATPGWPNQVLSFFASKGRPWVDVFCFVVCSVVFSKCPSPVNPKDVTSCCCWSAHRLRLKAGSYFLSPTNFILGFDAFHPQFALEQLPLTKALDTHSMLVFPSKSRMPFISRFCWAGELQEVVCPTGRRASLPIGDSRERNLRSTKPATKPPTGLEWSMVFLWVLHTCPIF